MSLHHTKTQLPVGPVAGYVVETKQGYGEMAAAEAAKTVEETSFPEKLMDLLRHGDELKDSFQWESDGQAFRIFLLGFNNRILSKSTFRGVSTLEDFVDKLDEWQFITISEANLPGSLVFQHPLFQKSRPDLIKDMRSRSIQSTRVTPTSPSSPTSVANPAPGPLVGMPQNARNVAVAEAARNMLSLQTAGKNFTHDIHKVPSNNADLLLRGASANPLTSLQQRLALQLAAQGSATRFSPNPTSVMNNKLQSSFLTQLAVPPAPAIDMYPPLASGHSSAFAMSASARVELLKREEERVKATLQTLEALQQTNMTASALPSSTNGLPLESYLTQQSETVGSVTVRDDSQRRRQGSDEDEDDTGRFRPYQEDQWHDRMEDLQKYHQEHGNCLVPHTYPPNQRLARWVKRQRYQYKLWTQSKRSTMTDERVTILGNLGFVWDSQEASWYQRWKELRDYRNKFNNCNVPANYKPNLRLARWVKCQRRQRKLFREGKPSNMTPQRVKDLESLGFQWLLRAHAHPSEETP